MIIIAIQNRMMASQIYKRDRGRDCDRIRDWSGWAYYTTLTLTVSATVKIILGRNCSRAVKLIKSEQDLHAKSS